MKTRSPLITVIVPVYNVVGYLPTAVESVIDQTCSDWECICVDDGSTDGSAAILDGYAARDARIRVFHTPNQGVSKARNRALDSARGEWICFLDGDDALHPRLFEILLRRPDAGDGIDLISYRHRSSSQFDVAWERESVTKEEVVDLQDFIPREIADKNLWENAYRARLLSDIRFQPYPIGEDKLFLAEALCRSRKAICTDLAGYWYRIREGSAIHSKMSLDKIRSHFAIGLGMLKLFTSQRPHRVDRRVVRGECVRISEMIANDLARIPPSAERSAFMREWCGTLSRLASCRRISRWFAFSYSRVGRWPFLWRVLFLFPFKAKLLRNRLLRRGV